MDFCLSAQNSYNEFTYDLTDVCSDDILYAYEKEAQIGKG